MNPAARLRVQAYQALPRPSEARACRRRAGLPAALAAKEIGVHKATLLRWEAGTCKPRGEHVERWARLLAELADVMEKVS